MSLARWIKTIHQFIILIYSLEFSYQRKLMVFHWRLSDIKSSQVSRTHLSILAVTVPKAPITIGIIVTFMFHSFFNSLARSRYLSLFSHSFSFILWSAGTAKSTILQFIIIIIIIHFAFGLVVFGGGEGAN